MHRKGSRQTPQDIGVDTSASRLSDDQIDRLAAMIANGCCEWPTHFPARESQRLQVEVRSRLRHRLIRLVARAIALDVRGMAQPE
jgi:hypothetical protein